MQRKNQLQFLLLLLAVVMITSSCQKESDVLPIEKTINQVEKNKTEGLMKIGKQLQNPYSVDNMKKALASVETKDASGRFATENLEIVATHRYIKFSPKTEKELDILKNDHSIILYTFPLDYEILENGSSYVDPAVAADQPTYQYASIPVNKVLPEGVPYEVLAELFIPDEESDLPATQNIRPISDDLVDALVTESLRLTDNTDEVVAEDGATSRATWRPAGTIRLWDDNFAAYQGLEGVVVRARRWFTTHTGTTNSSGDYSCNGTFKKSANYSIIWERYDFEIRDGWLSRAKYDGPKKTGDWNLYIRYGAQEFYGLIFQASHHYYYKNISGLRRPPLNGFWNTQLKIRAHNEENDEINGSHCPACRFLGLGSAVQMYNPQRDSRENYGTVIHELAHASHWSMSGSDYNNAATIVAESWARGVQRELTAMVYPGYDPPYFVNYTGVVRDMMDGLSGSDQVSGYSIRQIEDSLEDERTWNGWENAIRTDHSNPTEGNLDDLFDFWE